MAYDWRTAEAWLASGGEAADGHDIPGVRLEIDRARLREGYDAAAAGRVTDAFLAHEQVVPWFEDDVEALKAAGAVAEMRRGAGTLAQRGRRSDRSFEDRTQDFGVASILFEAAGDREAALAAAREGARLTPRAVAERLPRSRTATALSPAERAERANGFGTLPVERLYRLGAREEALANGYLAGRDRYLAELEMGERPDPAWIAGSRIDYQLKLVVPALAARRARSEAADLLARLRADPEAWAAAGREELMMLAALAGDAAEVDAIFAEAVGELDGGWSAIRLAIGRRAADAALGRDQSP